MIDASVNGDLSGPLGKFLAGLDDALIEAAGDSWNVIVGRSTTQYMRDAKGEGRMRRPDDTGPLRIVSGRLVRSLVGARTGSAGPESIYRVERAAAAVTITFGSRVPYANIHENSGFAGPGRSVFIPGRPYLGPALDDSTGEIINVFDQKLQELAKASGL